MKHLLATILAALITLPAAHAGVHQLGGQARFEISFPETHPDASLMVSLERTVRVPDDGKTYPLPPSLGSFPAKRLKVSMRCRDENRCPHDNEAWLVPMLQSEAMWINFESRRGYPFRIRILAGRIDAVSGETVALEHDGTPPDEFPEQPQGFVEIPIQQWLDGFRIAPGIVRQLVAEPLGKGRTAEEQLSDEPAIGGLWIGVRAYRAEPWEQIQTQLKRDIEKGIVFDLMSQMDSKDSMGLAPGGAIVQQILKPVLETGDFQNRTEWFRIDLVSSLGWVERTGRVPPQAPPDADVYTALGLPWFTYWDRENAALAGDSPFSALRTLAEWNGEDETVTIPPGQVRDLSQPLQPTAIGK